MKIYVIGEYVEEEALDRAMEAAYEALPENQRSAFDAAVERSVQAKTRPRDFGQTAAWEFLTKLGVFLADNPEIQARFDENGKFETFVRVKPTDHREKQIRSFLL